MPAMQVLFIAWAGLTTVLVLLLIYRSTLTMHEDDQIFLDESESHMQKEQEELVSKINRIQPFVRLCAAGSGLLILVIAGMWVYEGLTSSGLR